MATHAHALTARDVSAADRQAPNAASAAVKHTIQLPTDLWSALEGQARQSGLSRSEALRRAIWLFTYVMQQEDGGAEIIIRHRDGSESRLVLSPY